MYVRPRVGNIPESDTYGQESDCCQIKISIPPIQEIRSRTLIHPVMKQVHIERVTESFIQEIRSRTLIHPVMNQVHLE